MPRRVNLSAEYRRVSKEMGKLLRFGRRKENLDPETIAEQAGFPSIKDIFRMEQGHHTRLRDYLELARYYGMCFHLSLEYVDDNLNQRLRQRQAQKAQTEFWDSISSLVQRYRRLYHYTVRELSEITGIPVERIRAFERDREEISMKEVFQLMACFSRGFIPEAYSLG